MWSFSIAVWTFVDTSPLLLWLPSHSLGPGPSPTVLAPQFLPTLPGQHSASSATLEVSEASQSELLCIPFSSKISVYLHLLSSLSPVFESNAFFLLPRQIPQPVFLILPLHSPPICLLLICLFRISPQGSSYLSILEKTSLPLLCPQSFSSLSWSKFLKEQCLYMQPPLLHHLFIP